MSFHQALKTTEVANAKTSGVDFKLIELRKSKTISILTLHARPFSFSTSGLQATDFLAYCGFERDRCVFFNGECYVREVSDDFQLEHFTRDFEKAKASFSRADSHLQACGLYLGYPEGYGYFNNRGSKNQARRVSLGGGDGHTSGQVEQMKNLEDESFLYSFTWIKSSSDKGWTTHYHPKSLEVLNRFSPALQFIGLNRFAECPEFDFEPCFWRFLPCVASRGGFHDNNAHEAHGYFDATPKNFSEGLSCLSEADALLRTYGIRLLPNPSTTSKSSTTPKSYSTETTATKLKPPQMDRTEPNRRPNCFISYSHDDATHRDWVLKLASDLSKNGISVALDRWDLRAGDDLQQYMEKSITESEFVIMVCTTLYTEKANQRTGGVGYESGIVSAKIYEGMQPRKFVPLIRSYDGTHVRPTFLGNRLYIDFSSDFEYASRLTELLRHLFDKHADQRPPIGDPPSFE